MPGNDIPDYMPKWIQDHLDQYRDSNGTEGHMWDSSPAGGSGLLPCLILTTVGSRSGTPRPLPLIYGPADGGHVVIASKGGAPDHPAWYTNLVANPEVGVQVGTDKFAATARTAAGEERTRLWDVMVELYPPYVEYQGNTEREIPVVVLKRKA